MILLLSIRSPSLLKPCGLYPMQFLLFPQGRRRKLLIHRPSTTRSPQQRQHQVRLPHLLQSLQLMRDPRQLPTQTRLRLKPQLLCSPIPGKRSNPVSTLFVRIFRNVFTAGKPPTRSQPEPQGTFSTNRALSADDFKTNSPSKAPKSAAWHG